MLLNYNNIIIDFYTCLMIMHGEFIAMEKLTFIMA